MSNKKKKKKNYYQGSNKRAEEPKPSKKSTVVQIVVPPILAGLIAFGIGALISASFHINNQIITMVIYLVIFASSFSLISKAFKKEK